MEKRPKTRKAGRRARRPPAEPAEPKATTFRIEPELRDALNVLQSVLRRPLNALVNEALRQYIGTRSAEVESDLEEILTRVRQYRRTDPDFEKAIERWADSEARFGSDDPVEGTTQHRPGPSQAMVRDLLNG